MSLAFILRDAKTMKGFEQRRSDMFQQNLSACCVERQ